MLNPLNMAYAKYTIVFDDVLDIEPTLLDNLTLDTEEHTAKFKTALVSRWGLYEIGGETIPQFKSFLEHRFNLVKDYYIEKLNAYETQINMLDGAKVVTTTNVVEENTTNTTGSSETTTDNEAHDHITSTNNTYDLPRKQVNEGDGYLTSKTTDDRQDDSDYNTKVVGTTQNDGTAHNTSTGTTTTTGGINVIQLKKDYLDLLRNVYEEFANEFKTCFCLIYGTA